MHPTEALVELGGVAEYQTLLSLGVSRRDLASAVGSGLIQRPRRGCYSLPDANPVRVAEVAWRAPSTCVTAISEIGLPLLHAPVGIHLAFDRARSFSGRNLTPPAQIVAHFHRGLSTPPLLPGPLHAVDSSSLCLEPIQQLVVVDAALNRGVLRIRDIDSFRVTPLRRRTWLARNCDPRSQSMLETLTRLAMREAHLPVRTQVILPEIGRVDFVVGKDLIVEVDGKDYHSDGRAFKEDRRRDRAALLTGYRALRFTYSDVVGDIRRVVREVAQAHRLYG